MVRVSRLITDEDVQRCALAVLDYQNDCLIVTRADSSRGPELLPTIVPVAAHRVAESLGRPSEVAHFQTISAGIMAGTIGTELELVECRTADCSRVQTSRLGYVGASCQSCRNPERRALGPIMDSVCPEWCVEHPIEETDEVWHTGAPLAETSDLTAYLQQPVFLRAEVLEAGALELVFISGSDGQATLPVTTAALDALAGVLEAGRRHA